jgi:membrane associated rhomboid family serine protease
MYQDSYKPKLKFYWGGKMTAAVRALLIINGAVYLGQIVANSSGLPPGTLERLLGVSVSNFWPWQLITSMFLHSTKDLFHIIFNMLWLWMLGKDVERTIRTKKFLILYLAGGVVSGLCWMAICAIRNPAATAIGASGAVFAILVAYAVLFPDRRFWFFKARYFVIGLIVFEVLLSVFGSEDGVAHVAHVGGAAFGFLFFKGAPVWQNFTAKMRERKRKRRHLKEVRVRTRVDALLDKINKSGIDSLSGEEKAFLKKASSRFR